MKTFLLIAHGSRRTAANEEVRMLARRVARELSDRFERVDCAFLELATPQAGDAIDEAAAHGAHEVVLLPYFLGAGRHVADDMPAVVAAAQQRHPGLRLRLLPHLGALPEMPALIAGAAATAEPTPEPGRRRRPPE